jgi:hypothetical protein
MYEIHDVLMLLERVKKQKEQAIRIKTECEEFTSILNQRMNGVQRKGFGRLSSLRWMPEWKSKNPA